MGHQLIQVTMLLVRRQQLVTGLNSSLTLKKILDLFISALIKVTQS